MLLSVENLHVKYGNIEALHGITFHVDRGEIVTLIGANGAGKTTTLLTVMRLPPPEAPKVTQGDIRYDGQSLLSVETHDVVRKLHMDLAPEGRRIFGNLTVMENLNLATYARKDSPEDKARDLDRVFTLFPRLSEAQAAQRIPVRRRTADAGRGPGTHDRLRLHPPRRAVHGAGAAAHVRDVSDPQKAQRTGHDHPARRTKRQGGPGFRPPGVRPGYRRDRGPGLLRGTAPRSHGQKKPTSAAKSRGCRPGPRPGEIISPGPPGIRAYCPTRRAGQYARKARRHGENALSRTRTRSAACSRPCVCGARRSKHRAGKLALARGREARRSFLERGPGAPPRICPGPWSRRI